MRPKPPNSHWQHCLSSQEVGKPLGNLQFQLFRQAGEGVSPSYYDFTTNVSTFSKCLPRAAIGGKYIVHQVHWGVMYIYCQATTLKGQWDFLGRPVVKNLPASAGYTGSILGSGRSSGEGNGNPLQCSCLENPRDGEPGGLQSMGSHRVRHDWATELNWLKEVGKA